MTDAPLPAIDVHDEAALYAAGLLDAAAHDAFEDRLLSGDPAAVAAFQRVGATAARLVEHALVPADPPLIARSNILNAIGVSFPAPPFAYRRPESPRIDDAADMVLMDANETWEETGLPGVQTRRLFVDLERRRLTVLIRAAAGTVFPDHDHADVEECLVLEGDLELGGKVLRKMDYMRIPKGGQHGTPRTRNGCVLLVTCALVDAA